MMSCVDSAPAIPVAKNTIAMKIAPTTYFITSPPLPLDIRQIGNLRVQIPLWSRHGSTGLIGKLAHPSRRCWNRDAILLNRRDHQREVEEFVRSDITDAVITLTQHLEPFAHLDLDSPLITILHCGLDQREPLLIRIPMWSGVVGFIERNGISNVINPAALRHRHSDD